MNEGPLLMEQPLEIDDARRASRRLAELRRGAEDAHSKQVHEAAQKERDYRKAYAQAFLGAEGTVAEREEVARQATADDAYQRDLTAGMVKVCAERLRGLEGERSQLKSLIEWSARMNLDERGEVDAERARRQAA